MPEIIFDTKAVNEALDRLAQAMMQDEVVNLIGIQRGGAEVANALQQRLEQELKKTLISLLKSVKTKTLNKSLFFQ